MAKHHGFTDETLDFMINYDNEYCVERQCLNAKCPPNYPSNPSIAL